MTGMKRRLYPQDPYAPYQKCSNPECERLVGVSIQYCCGSCAFAHKQKFQIHEDGPLGHTESCNERHEERKDWRDR